MLLHSYQLHCWQITMKRLTTLYAFTTLKKYMSTTTRKRLIACVSNRWTALRSVICSWRALTHKTFGSFRLSFLSFVMPEYGSRYTSSMYMRGIGSRINSPAVGMYVDNMPIQSKSAFNFHTYDIDRVDVLHGPQGTLYGMNTEGGLIRLYSKNPFVLSRHRP